MQSKFNREFSPLTQRLRNFFGLGANKKKIGRGTVTARRRIFLEALEDRRVLAVFSIDNPAPINEGNAGTQVIAFTVSRDDASAVAAIDYQTSDGTAQSADNDYVAIGLTTLNFAVGEFQKIVNVTINGDVKPELNESFAVNLLNASAGNTIGDDQGISAIANEDFDWTIDGTASADSITLVRSGANLIASGLPGGNIVVPVAPSNGALNSITINGLASADIVTIDYSGGNFPVASLAVNGGDPAANPGDRLVTVGGNFATGNSNPTNGHDGALVYTGGTTGASTINYTGLEPIDDLNVVANYVINGTNALNFINIVDGPLVLGTQTTQVNDGAALFELVNFANKSSVTINALDGSDQIAINNPNKGVGLASLIVNGGNGDDQFNVHGPGIIAGTTFTFNGGNDNDLFSVSGGLLGAPITINGNTHTGGTPSTSDRLTVNSFAANVTQTATQLQFSGGSAITFGTLEQINLNNLGTLSVSGTGAADALLLTKPSPTNYRSVLNGGIEVNFDAPVAVVGAQFFANLAGGSDTLTVDNTDRVVNLRVGFNAGAGVDDTLEVFGDPGAPVARESYITGATQDAGRLVLDPDGNMGYLKTSVVAANGDELDVSFNGLDPIDTDVPALIFDVVLSAAVDNAGLIHDGVLLNGFQSMLIQDNSGTFEDTRFANKTRLTVSGFTARDVIGWNHNGNLAAGLTDVEFYGFLPVGLGVDDAPASDVNRDVVTLVDGAGALNIQFDYSDTASVVDVGGLAAALRIGTAETINFGSFASDDAISVIGTTADDDLTVAPVSAERAVVFLGGNPWDGPAEGSMFDQFPGIAGGSTAPDIQLLNVASLEMSGGGPGAAGDQLYVYGQSELALDTGSATDYFGFGAGVLMGSAAGNGFASAFDEIVMSDAAVNINAENGATPLLQVDINTLSFAQAAITTYGLIVNSGDEAAPGIPDSPGVLRADNIFLTPSPNFPLLINGGDPVPAFAPQGDKLNIAGPFKQIDVFSDKLTPPTVNMVFYPLVGPPTLPFAFSSIENLGALETQTVRLIGDNNDTTLDQNDNFVVRGGDVDGVHPGGDADGANEFVLNINGSLPISFYGVEFLKAYGDDQNPPPGAPSAGNDIDTLDIRAYADGAPQGWDIDVFFNEGNPPGADGAQADLIIYHTALGLGGAGTVSETVSVVPSGPDNGEIRVVDSAFGAPVVNIAYLANTDIIFVDDDGALTDTDTLNLHGTSVSSAQLSGNESFTVNLSAAGGLLTPQVVVADANALSPAAQILYRARSVTGFEVINILPGGGNDAVFVQGAIPNGFTVDGGAGNDLVDGAAVTTGGLTALGGLGNDIIIGTPNADNLAGGDGDDFLSGLGGVDYISGDAGNDTLIGGAGADRLLGGADNDSLIWDPGDGSDVFEGGAGSADVFAMNGGGGADTMVLTQVGSRLRLDRQPGSIVMDVADSEQVELNRDTTWLVPLAGAQEVPPNASPAVGVGRLRFNSATLTVDIDLEVSGINDPNLILDSHIHSAPAGVNGPVIVGIGGAAVYRQVYNSVTGLFDYRVSLRNIPFPALQVANLLAGNTYFNVHSTAFPGGEIRGQISVANLTAAQATGADVFSINDLTQTGVKFVNINEGQNDAGGADLDQVNVFGREVSDNLTLSPTVIANQVKLTGLPYDIMVTNSVAAQLDTLRVNMQGGNDVVNTTGDLSPFFTVTNSLATNRLFLNGGEGDDFISGFGALSGDAGDDTLVGDGSGQVLSGGLGNDFIDAGAGLDSLFGGDGDDVMIPGNDGVSDNVDGGDGWDQILFRGSAFRDVVSAQQLSNVSLTYSNATAGVSETDTLAPQTVEELRIETGSGNDTILVAQDAALFAAPGLQVSVDGGSATAQDRLGVLDTGAANATIQRIGADGASGTFNIGQVAAPIVYTNIEYARLEGINPVTGVGANGGRLYVFKVDGFEQNGSIPNATHLGVGETLNVDPTIDPGAEGAPLNLGGDEDFYRVEALRTGTLDFQVFFRPDADLPGGGNLTVTVHDATGAVVPAAFSVSNAQGARVRVPSVQGQIYYLRVDGTTEPAVNVYSISVVNEAAPTPFALELDDIANNVGTNPPGAGLNSDTGRSQRDNITFDNTPTIFLRLNDRFFTSDIPGNDAVTSPPIGAIAINPTGAANVPGFRIAIFDEGQATPPQTPLGFATLVAPGLYSFTSPLLLDGSHFLTARVQMIDPVHGFASGFGERSLPLEIVVDTAAPTTTTFGLAGGTDGLDGASDSGVAATPSTFADRITNDTTPLLWGQAEADTVIRLYVDLNGNGTLEPLVDRLIGQTVTTPLDGTNQFPTGRWDVQVTTDLNNVGLPKDGLRTLMATAEDVAGNVSTIQTLRIFLDTAGPQITNVQVNSAASTYDLFDPKPSTSGPTPVVNSLVISVRDLPARLAPDFLYAALDSTVAVAPGNYVLRGDANGIIPIQSIQFNGAAPANGQPATGQIVLTFVKPLPDDRFTLTIDDDVVDPAGNRLDGENNAAEPHETTNFPTGDLLPGGNFVARFTVDTRPEVGVWNSGSIYVDTNGNMFVDPTNPDFTNRDITYVMGFASDNVFAGNFTLNKPAKADGFDKIAAYGKVGTKFRWLIDFTNDGVSDFDKQDPLQLNGLPVAGNFDNDTNNGDEVGIFTGKSWAIDTNHDFLLDTVIPSNMVGRPVVGDFNGDGQDDFATWADDKFYIDTNRDGQTNTSFRFGFPGVRERPVAADMDKDGRDDLGLWSPDRDGGSPRETGEYYFLVSGGASLLNRIQNGPLGPEIRYKPVPFGNDFSIAYGDETAQPIVGNFDPPVTANGEVATPTTNPRLAMDVNNDGVISTRDVLLAFEALNDRTLNAASTSIYMVDTNGDGRISVADVLGVITALNEATNRSAGGGSGEAGSRNASQPIAPVVSTTPTLVSSTVDQAFSQVSQASAAASQQAIRLMPAPTDWASDIRGGSKKSAVDKALADLFG